MGNLTSPVYDWKIKDFLGMDQSIEEYDLNHDRAITAQNCRFHTTGKISKRNPISYYNSASLGANSINSIYRMYTSAGAAKLLAAYDTAMYVGNDTAGTLTAIMSSLTSGKRFGFATYRNLCYMGNGYDRIFVYDAASDNVCWDMGSCKALVGAAGNITQTTISYKITLDADALVTDAISNIITTVSSKKIELSNIPLGPVGTTNRKIYRKDSNTGGVYKLVTTLADNTTTTYSDNTNDVSGGAEIPAATDTMPKGNMLTIYKDRLFISGDPNNPNLIYYSNVYLPHYIQQTTNLDYMEIAKDDNDEIMGIPIQLGVMCVFKKNNIRKVYIGGTASTWYADPPISFVGTPAQWSVTQTPYGIVYLGWDRWYIFDGATSNPIVDEFDTDSILTARYSETVVFWSDGILKAAYTDAVAGNQYHDRVMHYDFKRKWLGYDKLNVNCFAAYIGDDETGDLYYGGSNIGFVYMAENNPLWIKYQKKTDLSAATADHITVAGTEDDPYIEVGRTETINALSGTIDAQTGTINMGTDIDGVLTFPSIQLNAGSFGLVYWNLLKYNDSDTCTVSTRVGATQAACEVASWSSALSNPNGSQIASTANIWFQLKMDMAANSSAGSPKVFFTDGYVIKFYYYKGGTQAETAVEWVYNTGYRHFDQPTSDKIFKRIATYHLGSAGTFTVSWTTLPIKGNSISGTFTVDLTSNPKSWESFFPSNAFGRSIALTFYKNDLSDFELKEAQGLFTPEPIII